MFFWSSIMMKIKQVLPKCMKKDISEKNILGIFLFILSITFIILLAPLLIAGFYNHMSGDDWFNAKFAYKQILDSNFSFSGLMKDCFTDLRDLYTRWSFTYTGYFFAYIMPAGFNENYAWLHTGILLFSTVISIHVFITKILYRTIGTNRLIANIVSILLLIVMIEYMPSPFDAFYWWSGSINNILGFIFSLFGIIFIQKFYIKSSNISLLEWIGFGILLFMISGTSYGAVLVLLSTMCLCLLDTITLKYRKMRQRLAFLGLFLIFIFSIVFAATAPGNGVRSEALHNMGVYGESAVKSILHAYKEGIFLLYESFSLCFLFILFLICFLLAPVIISKREKFTNPLLFLFLTYSILVSSFVPTLYAQSITGELRVRNIQYWYSIFFIVANAIYFLAWYMNRRNISEVNIKIKKYRYELMILLFICSMVALVKGENEPSSKLAYRELKSNVIQQFDKELDERETIYHNSRGEEVFVPPLSAIPDLFYGYTDIKDESYWINTTIRDYYQLNSLTQK